MKDTNYIGVLMRNEILLIFGVHIWNATVLCKYSMLRWASVIYEGKPSRTQLKYTCVQDISQVFLKIPLLDKHDGKYIFLLILGKDALPEECKVVLREDKFIWFYTSGIVIIFLLYPHFRRKIGYYVFM